MPVVNEILRADLRRRVACPRRLALADWVVDGSNRQEPVNDYYRGDDIFAPVERCRGVPIGKLISRFFASVYLGGFDHFCNEALHVKGFVRYVYKIAIFPTSDA